MFNNTLLLTDVYKMGHMEQYPPDTEEVYSYLEARGEGEIVFFGLQYLLLRYLSQPITQENADEFLCYYRKSLGLVPQQTRKKIQDLVDLGYWPLRIKAVPEGTSIECKNVLMTIRNTVPGFHWCVGFVESMLLKVWAATTVATKSKAYYDVAVQFAEATCDSNDHVPFQVHDFGYRGVSSEESAAIAGAAHLIRFRGSDNIIANKFVETYYGGLRLGNSIPASEHSVMCAFGREKELDAFKHMLETYPTGTISIVSDTYDLWNVLENFTDELRDLILGRGGKVVFRPDSGNPPNIICGDPSAPEGTPQHKGAIQILWEKFGGYTNPKGYKVINEKVGLIYGDAMYLDRFRDTLARLAEQGFASSNLVIGVGGLLSQNHTRDTYGFALKATRVVRSGVPYEIMKDPITDPGKKSKTGLMTLQQRTLPDGSREFVTKDRCTEQEEAARNWLRVVFKDGIVHSHSSFA